MCATTNRFICWEDIDFRTAEKHVKKLQKRIAKAYENQRHDVVINLQHQIIHSFYAKALAVKRVTTNKGRHTSGVDGITWNTSEEKFEAIKFLKRRGYKPMPLRRVYIPKGNKKLRRLSIPTMKDRAMQTLYKFALEPIAEITADECSYGFRPNRCAKDAVIQCYDILEEYPSVEWIAKVDIKSCFDNISHEWVLNNIFMDKIVLKKFLKSPYMDKSIIHPTVQGIPQGGAISCVICNMTLDGLEDLIAERCGCDVHILRYADDILVLGTFKPFFVRGVIQIIQDFLSVRNLSLAENKKVIARVNDGFTFLGWEISRKEGRVQAVPTRKNIDGLIAKIKEVLVNEKQLTHQKQSIALKLIIRGWLNYYSTVAPEQSLCDVANEVLACTDQWGFDLSQFIM